MAALIVTLFLGFAPMFLFAYILYWLDRYEKEPILLLGAVFVWGMVVAAGGAYILNTVFRETVFAFTSSDATSELALGSISAPLVEEGLKGAAVLLVFLLFYREFDSILDGIIYAGIAALGFAATENSLYIWRGFETEGWDGLMKLAFLRIIIVGWQHPVYTSFTGIGLATARMSRSCLVKVVAPLLGWGVAMLAHSLHNALSMLVSGPACFLVILMDWSGVLFMFGIILWAGWMEQRNLTTHLREEVELGVISLAQYRTACSAWAQGYARLLGLLSGRFMATSRFYQTCAELVHKKEQLRKLGQSDGAAAYIQKYRTELVRLAAQAQTA